MKFSGRKWTGKFWRNIFSEMVYWINEKPFNLKSIKIRTWLTEVLLWCDMKPTSILWSQIDHQFSVLWSRQSRTNSGKFNNLNFLSHFKNFYAKQDFGQTHSLSLRFLGNLIKTNTHGTQQWNYFDSLKIEWAQLSINTTKYQFTRTQYTKTQ